MDLAAARFERSGDVTEKATIRSVRVERGLRDLDEIDFSRHPSRLLTLIGGGRRIRGGAGRERSCRLLAQAEGSP
jgi:hypothetical protein